MRRPWVIDARPLDLDDPIDRAQIHTTPRLEEFLDQENKARTVLVAPKGFGKTLLIRLKRRLYEPANALLIPQNAMVDVAPGAAPAMARDQVAHIASEPNFWVVAWQLALTISVLGHWRAHDRIAAPLADRLPEPLRALLQDGPPPNPFTVFTHALRQPAPGFFAAQQALREVLVPAFSRQHRSTAVFVDNVDEYFDHVLTANDVRSGYFGEVDPQHWYAAQVGLLSAIHLLRAQNPHVKIFAAIRTEAWHGMRSRLPNAANLLGGLVFIEYRAADLVAIFARNIAAEARSNLCEPTAEQPSARFFGHDGLALRHRFTGELEPMEAYLLRHTLGRPRDLMILGHELSRLRPADRRGDALRHAVDEATRTICGTYLGEVRPHLRWLDDEQLFPLIDRGVLSRQRLREIADACNARLVGAVPDLHSSSYRHVFCDLFRAGLLGYVAADGQTGTFKQRFQTIAEQGESFFRPDGLLPRCETYVIHPVLASVLQQRVADFPLHPDTRNVIASDAPWRFDDGRRLVVHVDIRHFSRVMRDPAEALGFRQFFRRQMREICRYLEYFDNPRGDDMLLIDHSAYQVVRAIAALEAMLNQGPHHLTARFGLDFGVVTFSADEGEPAQRPDAGLALRRAARLEAVGRPGVVLLTEAARSAILPIVGRDAVREITESWPGGPRRSQEGWDVGKPGEEGEPVLSTLFEMDCAVGAALDER